LTTTLITNQIWNHLTTATRRNKSKSIVAVAYFSEGASKLLPLSEGSLLLIDASEKAVKSGQTHPNDLLELYNMGVKIYSKEWLHAKMFVLGNTLYIGSTNASKHSSKLVEAILKTSDKKTIQEAKAFINSYCKLEMGEEQLKRLQKKYRKPKFIGAKENNKKSPEKRFQSSTAFYVYHLKYEDYSKDERIQSAKGKEEVKNKRLRKTRHKVDEFLWTGKFPPKKGDIIMQVTDNGDNAYVSPPGTVIHQRRWKNKTMCYLEVATKRRKSLKYFKKHLSGKDRKLIDRSGKRNNNFVEAVNSIWS